MRLGLTGRVAASHVAVVVLSLLVFSGTLVAIAGRGAGNTAVRVDRATAVRVAPLIEDLYRRRGEWADVATALRRGLPGRIPTDRMGPGMMMGPDHRMPMEPVFPGFAAGIVITDLRGETVATVGEVPEGVTLDPRGGVLLGPPSDPVGRLYIGSMITPGRSAVQEALIRTVLRAAVAAGGAALLGAVVVSALWAQWLLQPIRALDLASRALAQGDRTVQVHVPRGDHELRTLAESFNAMVAEVEQQERVRRRFVADAAHELRTPISLLSARIEMLRDGVYQPDGDQWRAMADSVGRIAALVEDLQTLARLDAGRVVLDRRPIPVDDLIAELHEQFRPVAERRAIRIEVTAQRLAVCGDRPRLMQALLNVVSNAVRHSPDGGTVAITATDEGRDTVVVAVEDDGQGIPPEDRDRVFERFVRLDRHRGREQGGSGLGLAIVRHLIELHGGTVGAGEPYRLAGARIEIRLPAPPDGAGHPPPRSV